MIARLFPASHKGFYIDVGAADPAYLSVTKHFYDAGWSGVNVEPLPRFMERLRAQRPRDVNVHAMVGGASGRATFYEITDILENSTSDPAVMEALQREGHGVERREVEVVTLREICERHAAGRMIDFLKIDVEGGERALIESGDWTRFRPVLVVIEAVSVNGREPTWGEWEHLITGHGYEKVWFDGLNNFYLRQESAHLREHFVLPPGVFDGFRQSGFTVVERPDGAFHEIAPPDAGMAEEISVLRACCAERLALIEQLQSACDERLALASRLERELAEAHRERLARESAFHATTAAQSAEIALLLRVCEERQDLIRTLDQQLRNLSDATPADLS